MKVLQALEKILADSYMLYSKTQNYHWNVTGAEFKSLHLLFEDQYQELSKAIDEIAERIRTLGSTVLPLTNFIKIASISQAMLEANSTHMLKDLAKDQEIIISNLYKALKVAQEEGDEGTSDIIISRIKTHEKNKWMLTSSIA